METLEFIIHADGRVQEVVTGIVGKSCEEVTAAIEAQLGDVLRRESTAEYYQQPAQQPAQQSVEQGNETLTSAQTYSNWV
ncbi:MAG: DUF2997 domain-containing protein [Leptolyngbya sp. RL_3_1]|nr:DUF2997 domain-containing protein [Leptolyngbya sp. RL_3_1]